MDVAAVLRAAGASPSDSDLCNAEEIDECTLNEGDDGLGALNCGKHNIPRLSVASSSASTRFSISSLSDRTRKSSSTESNASSDDFGDFCPSPRPVKDRKGLSTRESQFCRVCGHNYYIGARTCGNCQWPKGMMTHMDGRTRELSLRLQAVLGATADMALISQSELETRLRISPMASGVGMCEDVVTTLEEILPEMKRRIGNQAALSRLQSGLGSSCSIRSSSVHSLSSSLTSSSWQPDADECNVCQARLGKRFLRPRHHCRACGECVCAKCSPNRVELDGKMSRVCTPCVTRALSMRQRTASSSVCS